MSKNKGFTEEELNAAMIEKYKLDLTEEEYIDLIEAVDLALNNIMQYSIHNMKHTPLKEGQMMQQKIFKQCIKEYDGFMTIRAKLIKWKQNNA